MGGGIGPFGFNAYPVRLALTPSGHLIAAGNFTAAGGVANTNGIARWDGSAWNSVAPGTNSGILAIAVRPNGNIIATGSFTALGGTPVNRIAEWDGSAWRPFGSGLTEPAAQGRAIALAPNGDVILGGHFAAVGGIAADNVARWNGHAWRAVGDGLGFPGDTPSTDEGVNDLKFDPATGDLWAAGTFVASGGRLVMGIARVTLATQYADITQQPTPAAGCPGEPASFTIRVQSAAPVTYRWSHNGAPIDSATNPSALSDTLVIPAVAPADAGEYRCTVTDGCTSTPSTPATLTYLACCPDFDLDGNADQADVWYLINAVTGGPNPSGRDLDFNHDGSTDMTDVDSLVNTIAGAGCP